MPGSLTVPNILGVLAGGNQPVALIDADFTAIITYVNAREVMSGTLAARPAAGVSGRWYFATDLNGGTLTFDTGLAWVLASPGISVNGIATPQQFGAVGDGVHDDTAAVQAAVSTGCCYLPPGTYKMTAALTLLDASCSIWGAGIGVSALNWTAAGGIAGVLTNILHKVTLRDFSLQAGLVAAGTAVSLTWPVTASTTFQTCVVENLEIIPTDPTTGYWTKGVVLSDGWNSVLRNLTIRGKNSDHALMTEGIELLSTTVACVISDCHLAFMDTGIHPAGLVQGCHVVDCTIIYTTRAILAESGPLLMAKGNDISAFLHGIELVNCAQAEVIGNLIYLLETGATVTVGILVSTNSSFAKVQGNHIVNIGGGSASNGIVLASGTDAVVVGNGGQVLFTFIWGQATSSAYTIGLNREQGGGTTVLDQGGGVNIVVNNGP